MAPSQDTVSLSFSRVVSDVSPWIIENSTKLETLPQEVGCFIRPFEPLFYRPPVYRNGSTSPETQE